MMDFLREDGCLYRILGVGLTARADEIRQAYRRLARQWHPDRHRGDDIAKRRFQEIQQAYEVLMDTRKRQLYDLQLLHLLDVEDYLSRFKELILTANGLDMSASQTDHISAAERHQMQLWTAA
eukprot:jgi/Chrzof1/2610/Cz11g22110.t1